MAALEDLGLDWSVQEPSKAAVYSATLAATGRTEEALRLINTIGIDSFREEERALVEEFLP